MKLIISIFLCLLLSSTAHAQTQKKITILIYVDKSSSMVLETEILTKTIDRIAARLKESCGEYRIAVSGIAYREYKSTGREPLKIIGNPRFITDKDGDAGLQIIKDRIKFDYATASDFTNEVLYSSIADSIAQEAYDLVESDFVATLLITDAAAAFEDYTPKEALERVYQFIPPHKFMASSIAPDFDQKDTIKTCDIDKNGKQPDPSIELDVDKDPVLGDPKNFYRASGGELHNICLKDIENQVDQFMNLVLANAQCLIMM